METTSSSSSNLEATHPILNSSISLSTLGIACSASENSSNKGRRRKVVSWSYLGAKNMAGLCQAIIFFPSSSQEWGLRDLEDTLSRSAVNKLQPTS